MPGVSYQQVHTSCFGAHIFHTGINTILRKVLPLSADKSCSWPCAQRQGPAMHSVNAASCMDREAMPAAMQVCDMQYLPSMLVRGTLMMVIMVSAGKSQLCMQAAAASAARGECCVYLDTTAACIPSRLAAMCQHPEAQEPVCPPCCPLSTWPSHRLASQCCKFTCG